MGNTTSSDVPAKEEKPEPKLIGKIVDYIATHYILTSDFVSLRKLYDKNYCDKLVILTSDILDRQFTTLDITYLAQRIKEGVEVNEPTNDKITFVEKEQIPDVDVKNSVKKRRMCAGIAKFYIKIAHIFSAIVMTINPTYIYQDDEGNTKKANFFEKSIIPINAPRDIYKLNICENRITSLRRGQEHDKDVPFGHIHPNVCSINVNNKAETKNLMEEVGIPELMELYMDDEYDFNTGKFNGMSEESRKKYEEDLKIFYEVFTGKTDFSPEKIKQFSDIKLRDYCKNAYLDTNMKIDKNNELFIKYADNLSEMIRKMDTNQTALIEILNQLFAYTIEFQTNKRIIRVHPNLTEDRLQKIVVDTRSLIIKLYLTCETDYTNGIKIYEAIIEQAILKTTQNQIKNLEKASEKLIGTLTVEG